MKNKKYNWNVFDKILLIMAIFIFVFVLSILIIFCIKGEEPGALIMGVFGLCAGECGFMAWIERKDKELHDDE